MASSHSNRKSPAQQHVWGLSHPPQGGEEGTEWSSAVLVICSGNGGGAAHPSESLLPIPELGGQVIGFAWILLQLPRK